MLRRLDKVPGPCVRRLGGLAVLAALAGAGAGCADGSPSISILGNKSLRVEMVSETEVVCLSDPSLGGEFKVHGTLAVGGPNAYFLTPLIRNDTVSNPDLPNDNVVYINGANVEIVPSANPRSEQVVAGLGELRQRSHLFSAVLDPDGSLFHGLHQAIDVEQAAALGSLVGGERVEIVTRTRLFGEFEGSSFETAPFDFPVTICPTCPPIFTCYGGYQ